MTQQLRLILIGIACLALATSAAFGQRQKLEVGHNAPALDVESWIKGDPVTIQPGKVYVVEFWASWCGPCIAAIPHLTELQEKYKHDDVVIIGINDGEDEATATNFVRNQGKRMGYTVAVDRRDSTVRAWRKAAGVNGIPASFVVDRKGKIAFIGNPHDPAFEQILDLVVLDRYDPVAVKQGKPLVEAAERARQMRNFSMAERHYKEVVELNSKVFFREAIEIFEMRLVDMRKPEEAYQYLLEDYLPKYAADSMALTAVAEKIATDPEIAAEHRSMEAALQIAQAAVGVAEGRFKPAALATLAQIHHANGDLQKAVEFQREAYFVARPDVKPGYRQTLDQYQRLLRRGQASRR